MRIVVPFLFALLLVGCNQSATNSSTSATETAMPPAETTAPPAEKSGEVFGTTEDFSGAMSYASLVAQLGQADTLEAVAVEGEVTAVCQMKGCWMTIAGEPEMMVKFKDYGFFMPKDIDGRKVVMHGRAYYQVTPLEELRHYAEDAGKSPEEIAAITEPKKELRFLASGVLLLPQSDVEQLD